MYVWFVLSFFTYIHICSGGCAWESVPPASVVVQRPSVAVQRRRAWELLRQQAWGRHNGACRSASGSGGMLVTDVLRRDLYGIAGSNCLCNFVHIICMYLMCFLNFVECTVICYLFFYIYAWVWCFFFNFVEFTLFYVWNNFYIYMNLCDMFINFCFIYARLWFIIELLYIYMKRGEMERRALVLDRVNSRGATLTGDRLYIWSK
jgi:hypothetical protein